MEFLLIQFAGTIGFPNKSKHMKVVLLTEREMSMFCIVLILWKLFYFTLTVRIKFLNKLRTLLRIC